MLTDLRCKRASADRPRKLFDARGLYLLVQPGGAKYWRFKYRFGGRERLLSFGVYPEVGLAEARERRDEARRLLRDGVDPSADRRARRRAAEHAAANTFKAVGDEWYEKNAPAWSVSHAKRTKDRLAELCARLGPRPVAEISAAEVLEDVLRAIERRGALEIAAKTLVTASAVFRYAVATGRAKSDPTRDLRGALEKRKPTPYAALKAEDFPEFLRRLDAYDGATLTKLAIRLLMLTGVRTFELRAARWSEFDLKRRLWTIPGERLKVGEADHKVPLSPQAVEALEQVKRISGGREYAFPNSREPRRPMSENAILYGLYRMGYHGRATGHGFRSSLSTVANESLRFDPDVIEQALAHGDRDTIRAKYNRAEYVEARRALMQWWADWLDDRAAGKPLDGKVTPIRRRRKAA